MSTLHFDGEQRYRTVAEILSRLSVSPEAKVLDVGGGTGGLKDLLGLSSYHSLDLAGAGPGHTHASMESLPFPDASFEVVLQVDALEHVPPSIRERSLEEIARVSADVVLWLGPVENALVVEVEEDLCRAHEELFGGKTMEWLSEHRDYGLSESAFVVEKLSAGCQDTRIWFSCDLFGWWALKRLDLLLEAGLYQPGLEEALDRWYAASGWKRDYRVSETSQGYRMVFVGRKKGKLPENLSEPPPTANDVGEWRSLLPLLEIVARPSGLSSEGAPLDTATSNQLERISNLLTAAPPNTDSFLKRMLGGAK